MSYGIKVSNRFYDANIADDKNLSLSSERNLPKVAQEGTWAITASASQTNVGTTISHSLGYTPIIMVYGEQLPGDGTRIFYGGGYGFFGYISYADNTNLYISITPWGALGVPYGGTFHGYYYVYYNPLSI